VSRTGGLSLRSFQFRTGSMTERGKAVIGMWLIKMIKIFGDRGTKARVAWGYRFRSCGDVSSRAAGHY
jgi:hypothetical protein